MKASEMKNLIENNLIKHDKGRVDKIKMDMREFMRRCIRDIDRVALGFEHAGMEDEKFASSVIGMALETVYDNTGQYTPLCSHRPENHYCDDFDRDCPEDYNLNQRYEFKGAEDAEQYCMAVLSDDEQWDFVGTYYDMDINYWNLEMWQKTQQKMSPKFYEFILLIEKRWACYLFNVVMDDYTHYLESDWLAGLDDEGNPVIMERGGDYECYYCEELDTSCGETNNCINFSTHCRDCAEKTLPPAAVKIQALVRGNNQRWICPLYLFNKLS